MGTGYFLPRYLTEAVHILAFFFRHAVHSRRAFPIKYVICEDSIFAFGHEQKFYLFFLNSIIIVDIHAEIA